MLPADRGGVDRLAGDVFRLVRQRLGDRGGMNSAGNGTSDDHLAGKLLHAAFFLNVRAQLTKDCY
jgi:hypothetical protein